MDTTCTRIALGNILVLLLLCLPFLSIADVIYRPPDLFSVNCGSPNNFSAPDGRTWTGDMRFLSESHDSVAATALTPSTQQGPFSSARLSRSQFTYSFPVITAGPKFIRLFFYSTSYQNFDRSKSYFSVKAGPYTLLQGFNASLNADVDDDPGHHDILFREYCINLEYGQTLNITFIPSITAHPDSYAFISGIEIVSMPPYLYYTNPDAGSTGVPKLAGVAEATYPIKNGYALETKYRLRVGGADIPSSRDTDMLRTWDADDKYVTSPSVLSVDYGRRTKLSFTETPNYTAPDEVYRTLRNMGRDGSMNMRFNLTWQLPVDSGFPYLLRLHFCQLNPQVHKPGDLIFYIFIQDQLVEDRADILSWSDEQKGVPVVRDYAVISPANQGKAYLSLKMHPHPKSLIKDAQLNAIELFKINDSTGNLAGPNPDPPLQTPKVPLENSHKKSSSTTRTLAAVAGAVSGVVLLSFIVAFFLIKRKKNIAVDKGSKQKGGTSRGGGS